MLAAEPRLLHFICLVPPCFDQFFVYESLRSLGCALVRAVMPYFFGYSSPAFHYFYRSQSG